MYALSVAEPSFYAPLLSFLLPRPAAWLLGSSTAFCGSSPAFQESLQRISSILPLVPQVMLMLSLDYRLWISLLVSLASSRVLEHRAQSNNYNDPFFTMMSNSAIEILQPPASLNLSWPAIRSFNVTRATTTNISLSHDPISGTLPAPVCNGNLYGFNLDVASCHEAWTLLPRDTIARTFGIRGNGVFDIPTPFSFMSCKRVLISVPMTSPNRLIDKRIQALGPLVEAD